jgi:hypothetical protein
MGNGNFKRGQCKTGRYDKGTLKFNTCSTSPFTNKHRHYDGQIEVFWVYLEKLEKFYEIPVTIVSKTYQSLRIDPPKYKRIIGIRWAKDYEI